MWYYPNWGNKINEENDLYDLDIKIVAPAITKKTENLPEGMALIRSQVCTSRCALMGTTNSFCC